MKLVLIFVPIFLIIFASIIAYFVNHQKHINPGEDKISCPITIDSGLLKKCDPNDRNACTNCTEGLYSCITVNSANPYKIDQNGTTVDIPDGNWCLQPNVKTFPCNQFSGYPVLTKTANNEFAWRCQCKYPQLFSDRGEDGDCTYQTACGGTTNPLVCPQDATYCTPGKNWVDEPKYSPTETVCACSKGTTYIDKSIPDQNIWDKRCVSDTCVPGYSSDDDTGCICPNKNQDSSGNWTSYIGCPQNVAEDKKLECPYNECVQDPCNPNGYYDPNHAGGVGMCVCNSGYANKLDSGSVIKNVCYNPCDTQNNPCGDRGTCNWTINDKNTVVTICTDCKSPWKQDSTNMCNFHMRDLGDSCTTDSDCISDYCRPKYQFWGDLICQSK